MSADNTIAILITKSKENGKKEYRVKEIGNSEEIGYDFDRKKKGRLNEEFVLMMFGDCKVLCDENKARKKAERIEKKSGFVEYGICTFDFSHLPFPELKQLQE